MNAKLILLLLFIQYGFAFGQNQENWMDNKKDDFPQIVLTNQFQFHSRPLGLGASSFLFVHQDDTILITAKHLLGKDMGIFPEVPIDSANYLLKYWYAFPRSFDICSDSVKVSKVYNTNNTDESKDILALKLEDVPATIQPLRAREKELNPGEKITIIGCAYADSDCYQEFYNCKFNEVSNGKIWVRTKKFTIAGFSGAPAIDSNGKVVGVVVGAGEFGGKFYVAIEPISSLWR